MATARAVATEKLPVELISAFAADRLVVAAPILAAARLTAFEWGDVLAHASSECRSFIHSLRSDEAASVDVPLASAPARNDQPIPSISEVVARIERVRQSREPQEQPPSQALPSAAPLFRWESDEAGEIAWVDGVPRGPLIGRSIARTGVEGEIDQRAERAFAERMPFSEAILELAEGTPVAGRWKLSGAPAFDRLTGRFAGYRGVAEREGVEVPQEAPVADPDVLRELAHEIKTPLNAIVGFAEIISGQYLGPADHRYRARAGEIVGQAQLLLTAIEDLDFTAKLHSARGSSPPTLRLDGLLLRIAPMLGDLALERGAILESPEVLEPFEGAIDADLAERLVVRMCSTALDRAEPGERLRLSATCSSSQCRIEITKPRSLAACTEEQLIGSAGDSGSPGFELRLVRGLARLGNADLAISDSSIALVFPAARLGGSDKDDYSGGAGEGL
jgi:signal transduction histidine kinase